MVITEYNTSQDTIAKVLNLKGKTKLKFNKL